MASGEIITLNVGGEIMKTSKSTLLKSIYFKNYFERWYPIDSNAEIFVDYDPKLFIYLLNKLRNDNYVIPLDKNIITMFDYFGYFIDTMPKKVIQLESTETIKLNASTMIYNKYVIDTTKYKLISFNISFNLPVSRTYWGDYPYVIFRSLDIDDYSMMIYKNTLVSYFKDIPNQFTLRKYFLKKIKNCGKIEILTLKGFKEDVRDIANPVIIVEEI